MSVIASVWFLHKTDYDLFPKVVYSKSELYFSSSYSGEMEASKTNANDILLAKYQTPVC